MERNTQMNNNKPRNTISPREMNSNYNYQSHYNNYSNQQNHQPHSHSHSPAAYHPNSELINFVSNAWKEKVASAEYFKPENTTEKVNLFDLDSWLNAKMRNS
ncbi:hypothetical protein PVAND_013084 [Polypedilum vanderplanki]|uniref:Uncharacterized protein n=1 Tax=Polypedilum vanderplanki TaxID=319348 RepID=A0A9J6CPJ8_POLVA|nr:hypothetical protein PVAND_013084 [Polypedilum vanderplanki]